MDGIVLLHAFPYTPEMWQPQLESLSTYRVLTPNLLGFESFADAAQSALQEVDSKGWQKVVFVGISMGGYAIFRLWELAPERFAGMVLACTRAIPDSEEAKQTRAKQAERLRTEEGMTPLPDALLASHLGDTTLKFRPELLESVKAMILANTPELVIKTLSALANRPDSRPLLPKINVPTLVLAGEEDKVVSLDETKAMTDSIPNARLQLIPEAGHLANLENPNAFNTALLEFLAGLSQQS